MFEIAVLRFFGWATLVSSVILAVASLTQGAGLGALYLVASGALLWAVLLAFALIAEKVSDIADHLKHDERPAKIMRAERTAEPYDDTTYWTQRRQNQLKSGGE